MQVSNARRIIFTALAVVAFWVLAWEVYWMGCNWWYSSDGVVQRFVHFARDWNHSWYLVVYTAVIGSTGFTASMLLSLSLHNSIVTLRDRWFLLVTVMFCVSMYLCYDLGLDDVYTSAQVSAAQQKPPVDDWFGHLAQSVSTVQQNHIVSWSSLLPPLILTTAFVIFGAWRSVAECVEGERGGG